MIDTGERLRFLLMHALAVKGVASEATLADVVGWNVDDVCLEIEALLAEELVRSRKGKLGGFALTAAGKEVHAALLAAEAGPEATEALENVYKNFLPVNGRFKDLCTQWQLRGADVNDHSDTEYDDGVVAKLTEVDREAQSFLEPVSTVVPRFGRYPARLSSALKRLRGGDNSAFTKPLAESYHDVWMELHEDLIRSLGRTRGTDDEG